MIIVKSHKNYEHYLCYNEHSSSDMIKWASMGENMSSGFVNNKGTDHNAHPQRLISVFVILLMESIII